MITLLSITIKMGEHRCKSLDYIISKQYGLSEKLNKI